MNQQININSKKSSALVQTNTTNRVSVGELHKYTMGLFGIFTLFVITYPIAIHRVCQHEKFSADGSHVKSLPADYK